MGDRGFDDEIMELELDYELFSSPSPKTPPGRPATMTRANPLASLGGPLPKIGGASTLPPLGSKGRLGGGLNPLAARPVSVSTSAASVFAKPPTVTVVSLVFSLTLVTLTVAAGNLGARLLERYMQNRVTQVTMGLFVGTFVYTVVVLSAVGKVSRRR